MGRNVRSNGGAVALGFEFLGEFDIGDIIGEITPFCDILGGYEWPDLGLGELPDLGLGEGDSDSNCVNSRMG